MLLLKDRLFFSYGKNLAFEINNGKKNNLNCKKKILNEIIALVNSDKTPNEVLKIFIKNIKFQKIVKMSSSFKILCFSRWRG